MNFKKLFSSNGSNVNSIFQKQTISAKPIYMNSEEEKFKKSNEVLRQITRGHIQRVQAQQLRAQQLRAQQLRAHQLQAQQIQAQQIQAQQIQAQQLQAQQLQAQQLQAQQIQAQQLQAQNNNMILVYNITLSNTKIQLPLSDIQGILSINWGDNTINNELMHTYTAIGTYTISISPTSESTIIGRFGLDNIAIGIQYLTAVKSWGKFNIVSLKKAFAIAKNLIEVPTSLPTNENNEPIVTNMASMFLNAERFNQDISGWDVSSVTDMSTMFFHCRLFNQDISKWNISNVKNRNNMFIGASSFTPLYFSSAPLA